MLTNVTISGQRLDKDRVLLYVSATMPDGQHADFAPVVPASDVIAGRPAHEWCNKRAVVKVVVDDNGMHHGDHTGRFVEKPKDRAFAGTAAEYAEQVVSNKTVIERVAEAIKGGGVTFHLLSAAEPTEGYAVGAYPNRSKAIPAAEFTANDVVSFVKENADLLRKSRRYLGGWNDSETGTVWLDISMVLPPAQKARAIALGKAKNQIAIADIAAIVRNDWDNAFIKTGGDGLVKMDGRKGRSRFVMAQVGPDFDAEAFVAMVKGDTGAARLAKDLTPSDAHVNTPLRIRPEKRNRKRRALAALLEKFNANHKPKGSSDGGQFASAKGIHAPLMSVEDARAYLDKMGVKVVDQVSASPSAHLRDPYSGGSIDGTYLPMGEEIANVAKVYQQVLEPYGIAPSHIIHPSEQRWVAEAHDATGSEAFVKFDPPADFDEKNPKIAGMYLCPSMYGVKDYYDGTFLGSTSTRSVDAGEFWARKVEDEKTVGDEPAFNRFSVAAEYAAERGSGGDQQIREIIIAHEMGHVLMLHGGQELFTKGIIADHEMAKDADGFIVPSKELTDKLRTVSSYGATSPEEAFAEMTAAKYVGGKAWRSIHPDLRRRYDESLSFFKKYPPTITKAGPLENWETDNGISVTMHPEAEKVLAPLRQRIKDRMDALDGVK